MVGQRWGRASRHAAWGGLTIWHRGMMASKALGVRQNDWQGARCKPRQRAKLRRSSGQRIRMGGSFGGNSARRASCRDDQLGTTSAVTAK